jgi:predicted naringenin-chalcone synthase
MLPSILSIGTAVPTHLIQQKELAENLTSCLSLKGKEALLMRKIFTNTTIENRHSVIPDYQVRGLKGKLYPDTFPISVPGTEERNAIYKIEAPKLAFCAAVQALEKWGNDPAKITHVISVSCTGMMAPGLEFLLVDSLKLSRNCSLLGINFMGCFGAFRGLAVARSFALENPHHRILVVCTELCTLHMQIDSDPSTIVSNALFADGAAAAIVGCCPHDSEKALWQFGKSYTCAIERTLEEMTWEVGNYGFLMTLSESVPKWLKKSIKEFCQKITTDETLLSNCYWAVHPGGKAILKCIEEACGLQKEELSESWQILRQYGNMSSATFLFVLERILSQKSRKEWSLGLGFGPGLTLEGVLLKNVF